MSDQSDYVEEYEEEYEDEDDDEYEEVDIEFEDEVDDLVFIEEVYMNCPVCGERYVETCDCDVHNSRCQNGHHWYVVYDEEDGDDGVDRIGFGMVVPGIANHHSSAHSGSH